MGGATGVTGGVMGAVPTWVRLDLRRRWPSLMVLAVLVALVVGSGAAALAGARRQASVVDRLRSDALGMDALIAANPQIHYPWARFDELSYVEGRWGLVEFAGVKVASIPDGDWLTTTGDAAFGSTVDRFVVLEGRAYDPATPGELVVSPQFAKANHVHVGDTLDVTLPTIAQARKAWQRQENAETITGPHTTWRVVGIVTNTWLGPPESSSPLGKAAISPATLVADRAHLLGDATIEQATVGSIFRLADPATDIARLTADARRLSGKDDVDVWNIDERFYKPARDSNRFEALTLAAFGALALLAGLFLVGSSVARASAAEAIELRRGMAVGMTPGQVTVAASVATALACAAGTLLGLVAAYAGSRWLPIGDARLYEPRPGASFDAPVLLLTGLIVGAAFALLALAAAWRQATRSAETTSGRASRLATRLADISAPVPVVMGTRLALETSPGRNAVPVRPAQIGAVLAVLGTVAVLVMSAGVSDALAHPERFGDVGQVNAFAGYGGEQFVPDDAIAGLQDLDYISGVWAPLEGNATADGGRLSTIVYSGPGGPKPLSPTLFDGRLPQAPDEVFLAVRTARALSAGIGDDVVLTGTNRVPRHLRVTGLGFLPPGAHNGYADGALVTPAGYPTLFAKGPHYFHFMAVYATAAGLTDAELAHRLEKDAPFGFVARGTGDERTSLREVQRLPIWLAGFLGLLGVGVVGNALVLAVRRRVGELAILRAVGMTGRQSVATVLTQAFVLILVGLAFGIPLGLALGRLTWRAIASFIPLQYVAPGWGTALLWVSGTALVLGLVLAVLPARRAARFALAAVLRAE